MMSAIFREKMSEPPPAEEVQVQVMVLVGVKVPSSLTSPLLPLPQAARDSVISRARDRAMSFFIVSFLLFI